jgi:hypothetical protein
MAKKVKIKGMFINDLKRVLETNKQYRDYLYSCQRAYNVASTIAVGGNLLKTHQVLQEKLEALEILIFNLEQELTPKVILRIDLFQERQELENILTK